MEFNLANTIGVLILIPSGLFVTYLLISAIYEIIKMEQQSSKEFKEDQKKEVERNYEKAIEDSFNMRLERF